MMEIIQTLNHLWRKKKRSLGGRLQKGISDLAEVLQPVGAENNYSQHIEGNEIQWLNHDGKLELLFFYISNPCDLGTVRTTFRRTRDTACKLSCIFVHQWTDGEGNWDVFGLHPQRGLVHWNRFWGQRTPANDTGPFLKEKFYSLFSTGRKFPLLSNRKWANLLEESVEKTQEQLSHLAGEFGCTQDMAGTMVRWRNGNGQTEVLFFIHQEFPNPVHYIRVYDQIEAENCPVTFLFQRAHKGVFDIFRFSVRSYLEHHNQVKF